MQMSTTTKRLLLAAGALILLLIVGLFIAQIGGSDGAGHPIATVAPSQSPSTAEESPSPLGPNEAVKKAYLHQWDVYASAVRYLKVSNLDRVFTGPALRVVHKEVSDLRRHARGVLVRVKHNLHVRSVGATTALVIDRYENHSVRFSQKTGKPTESDPNEIILEAYTLKKVQGLWKVSAIERQSVRPIKHS
jgi:hypothetical protein